MNVLNGVIDWQFLNEPLYRWGIFFFAISFMLWGWNGVIGLMK